MKVILMVFSAMVLSAMVIVYARILSNPSQPGEATGYNVPFVVHSLGGDVTEFNVSWWGETYVHVYSGNRNPIMENVREINRRGAHDSPLFILTKDDELWAHTIHPGTLELIMEDVASFHSIGFDRFAITNDNSLWWLHSYLMPFDGIIHMMDNVAQVRSVQSSHIILTLDGRLYTWSCENEPVFFMENIQHFSMGHVQLSAVHTKDGGFYIVNQGEATRMAENVKRYVYDGRYFFAALTYDRALYTIFLGEATRLLENVRDMRVKIGAVIAITYDKTLWGYGRSNDHWFGADNPRLETPQILMENVDRFSGGMSVIDTDGALWMWGRNTPPLVGLASYRPSRIMDNVDRVITSCYRAAYILTNCGELWGFGVIVARMIYTNATVIQESPIHITSSRGRAMQEPLHLLDNVQFVTGAHAATRGMAIDSDHVLWAWGFEAVNNSFRPVRVMEDVAYAISGYVITTEGALWTWGE